MSESNTSLRHSLLIRIAGAMTLVVLVVLAGMGGAVLIAETARGNANAINIAGSLRMQVYRLNTLVLASRLPAAPSTDQLAINQAMASFELTLYSPTLSHPDIVAAQSKSATLRKTLVSNWEHSLKPLLNSLQSQSQSVQTLKENLQQLQTRTNSMLTDINAWVKQIEVDTEARIDGIRNMVLATLFLTLLVMLLTMVFFHTALLKPLRALLTFTTRIRHGDLSARTTCIGQDELGRLGHAFNLMAEDLAALYHAMEARVAEKTMDLERSNRSLELLYHSIARLYTGKVEADTFKLLLREIEDVLELGAGTTCLVEKGEKGNVSILASTLQSAQGEVAFCSLSSCDECLAGENVRFRELAGQNILSIQLRDAERVHGVLQLIVPSGQEVEPWKMRLLEAIARHIGTAVGTFKRAEHERVVSLLEERSVIARELHDSLAQSLSYMKIQVSRLTSVLARAPAPPESGVILSELREGLNSAYRQLRELLTTFRLRIAEESLTAVLQKTVQEFEVRGQLNISLETQLTNFALSANEEIHILQIVREALANVVHHAHAQQASVRICGEAENRISLIIDDDGIGIGLGQQAAQTHHYGMSIMEERARSLGGALELINRAQGGTKLEVRFVPSSRRSVPLHQQSA